MKGDRRQLFLVSLIFIFFQKRGCKIAHILNKLEFRWKSYYSHIKLLHSLLIISVSYKTFTQKQIFKLLVVRFYRRCFKLCSLQMTFNPLNPELNPICYLLALLGAHHFLHVSRIRVKLLTFRLLMSYVYMKHPFLIFLDHTQRRGTVGRTPLEE